MIGNVPLVRGDLPGISDFSSNRVSDLDNTFRAVKSAMDSYSGQLNALESRIRDVAGKELTSASDLMELQYSLHRATMVEKMASQMTSSAEKFIGVLFERG